MSAFPGDLCRFCCKLKDDSFPVRTIFNDSSEETLNESNELIDKIHYTLYDNNVDSCDNDFHDQVNLLFVFQILEKVDFKLSNLMCKNCNQQILEFYKFKKQCDRNACVLMKVKIELDKMMSDSEAADVLLTELIDDSRPDDDMENEDEELSQESNEDDIEEVEEDSEDLEPSDASKTDVVTGKRANDLRKRERKSYKGKNSQCPICGKLVCFDET